MNTIKNILTIIWVVATLPAILIGLLSIVFIYSPFVLGRDIAVGGFKWMVSE